MSPDYSPKLGDLSESDFGQVAKSGDTPTLKMLIAFIQVRSKSDRHQQKNGGAKYRSGLMKKKWGDLIKECMKLKHVVAMKPLLTGMEREEEEQVNNGGVTMGVTL